MRPASIIQFERLYLAATAASLLGDLLGLGGMIAAVRAKPDIGALAPAVVCVPLAIAYAVMLALWYFAAHRRSVVAKWLIAGLFVLSTVLLALALFRYGVAFRLTVILGWAAYLLRAWAVSYLFKPDADAWFSKR